MNNESGFDIQAELPELNDMIKSLPRVDGELNPGRLIRCPDCHGYGKLRNTTNGGFTPCYECSGVGAVRLVPRYEREGERKMMEGKIGEVLMLRSARNVVEISAVPCGVCNLEMKQHLKYDGDFLCPTDVRLFDVARSPS